MPRYGNNTEVTALKCSHCGVAITGHSTQTIFMCAYCKSKVMEAELYESGAYRENMEFGYDHNMYDQALPVSTTFDIYLINALRPN